MFSTVHPKAVGTCRWPDLPCGDLNFPRQRIPSFRAAEPRLGGTGGKHGRILERASYPIIGVCLNRSPIFRKEVALVVC